MNALLFINGEPPKMIPNLEQYDIIACTDGALNYLIQKDFPLSKLNFVSGDFDSISIKNKEKLPNSIRWIHTPNQDFTDFHKALNILKEKKILKVDVFGGSGGEMDHFLGNLSVVWRLKDIMNITFYDEYSLYYFIPNEFKISNVKHKMISLYPFPFAQNVITKGLNWTLNGETLDITHRIGTRNFATEDEVFIQYENGGLLIFIER